jgi:ATP-dependent DNA helicase RecG
MFQPAVLPGDRPQTAQVTAQVVAQVIVFCQTPRRAPEIMDMLKVKRRRTFWEKYLNPLLEAELIERTIPDKPTSSKQRYQPGSKGRILLETIEPGHL